MAVPFLDEEELRVFRAFARATRRLFARFDQDLQRAVGMPRAYFEILWLLNEAPGKSLRMSDLAAATASQPSAITHAVGKLELAGHVRRELCPDDRRGWFTVLTDEGLAALQAAAPRYAESIRTNLLAPLSVSERLQLAAIGERLLSPGPQRDDRERAADEEEGELALSLHGGRRNIPAPASEPQANDRKRHRT